MYANVLLPLPLRNTFTYGVPIEFQELIQVGMRAEVSFGKNKTYSCIIKTIHYEKPEHFQVKPIISLLDKHPIVTQTQIEFWEWMARYYMCSEGEVMKAALPSYLKLEGESIVYLSDNVDIDEAELTDDEFILIEALKAKSAKS